MALPILLFDAERLSPALGYVFDPHWVNPDESMASILWKFARFNAIAGHVVVRHAAKQIVAVAVQYLAHCLGATFCCMAHESIFALVP